LRDFSFLRDGPTPPSVPVAPWQLEQLAAKTCLPLAGSPWALDDVVVVVVVVLEEPVVAAAEASEAGAELDVVVVVVDVVVWSLPPLLLEQPDAISAAIAPAARSANG